MTPEDGDDSSWAPPGAGDPVAPRQSPSAGADERWALRPPLGPPPAARQISAPPDQVDEAPEVVFAGPLQAVAMPRRPWIGRALSLVTAAVLVIGGGILAINAGSAGGGAGSPSDALRGMLDALSQEDLLGAAELLEPTERALLFDAGVDISEELVRLEVLSAELDLSAVSGVDLEFTGLEISSATLRPGVANVYLDGGRVTGSIDVSEMPFGALVLERAPTDFLTFTDTSSELIEDFDLPVVAVERDGRWYLSLWYTVAENARLAADLPLPAPADRPVPVGGSTAEGPVRGIVEAMIDFDLTTGIAMIDPAEAAALYDYAPLFLGDGQQAFDDVAAELRADRWQWQLRSLDLSSDVDGEVATVSVDGLSFEAHSPDGLLDVVASGESIHVEFVSPWSRIEVDSDGECTSIYFEDEYEDNTQEFCVGDEGIDFLGGGVFTNLQSLPEYGIVTHRVDDRWYISPTRTGTAAVIGLLQTFDTASMAALIDSFSDLSDGLFLDAPAQLGFDEGSGFAEAFPDPPDARPAPRPLPLPVYPVLPTITAGLPDPLAPPTTDNLDLLGNGFDYLNPIDINEAITGSTTGLWLPEAPKLGFGRGIFAQVLVDDLVVAAIAVVDTLQPAADPAILELLIPGDFVDDGGAPYVLTTTSWGEPVVVTLDGSVLIMVTSQTAEIDVMVEIMRSVLAR